MAAITPPTAYPPCQSWLSGISIVEVKPLEAKVSSAVPPSSRVAAKSISRLPKPRRAGGLTGDRPAPSSAGGGAARPDRPVRRHENGPPSATTPIQLRVVYCWIDAVGAVRRPHGKHMSPEWRGSRPEPRGARGRGASALRRATQGTTHPGTSPQRLQNASCR
jgi:hypothetical protein